MSAGFHHHEHLLRVLFRVRIQYPLKLAMHCCLCYRKHPEIQDAGTNAFDKNEVAIVSIAHHENTFVLLSRLEKFFVRRSGQAKLGNGNNVVPETAQKTSSVRIERLGRARTSCFHWRQVDLFRRDQRNRIRACRRECRQASTRGSSPGQSARKECPHPPVQGHSGPVFWFQPRRACRNESVGQPQCDQPCDSPFRSQTSVCPHTLYFARCVLPTRRQNGYFRAWSDR